MSLPTFVVRPDEKGNPDDIVVGGDEIEMFRAEDMGDWWWISIYFKNGEQLTWHTPRGKWSQIETPAEFEDWDVKRGWKPTPAADSEASSDA